MTAKFGTSGLRGLATDLIGETAIFYTRAFIQHLLARRLIKRGQAILVARDLRISSPRLQQDLNEALRLEGMEAIDFGISPTPALAYEAMKRKSAAIMITGSHIPGDRNGLKFYTPKGEITKLDERAIIKRRLKLRSAKPGIFISQSEEPNHFLGRVRSLTKGKPLKGLTIGVYQHSTVARDILTDMLHLAGAKVIALARSEEFIPVDTEALSPETEHLLREWTKSSRFDAIVSADGDGDRPLIADQQGKALRGDLIGLITALWLNAKSVVTPITSNSGIDAHLKKPSRRTKVGSPFVIAEMARLKRRGAKAIVGFEANGGFFTMSRLKSLAPLPTRDCFLPILAVLATARHQRQSLSELANSYDLPTARSGLIKDVPPSAATQIMNAAAANSFFAPLGKVKSRNTLDGLRVTLDIGIAHLRPSGNAPEFRIYVEAAQPLEADALLSKATALVKALI